MYDWNLTDPYLSMWALMGQAFDASNKITETELGRHDTTLAQFHVMMLLDSAKVTLTPGEISSYVFRERHSISALLTRMQKAGYVRKVRSKKDQRVVRIKLAPKGKELLDQVKPVGLKNAHDLLASCFSESELKELDKPLRKLRDRALKQLGKEAEPLPQVFNTPAVQA